MISIFDCGKQGNDVAELSLSNYTNECTHMILERDLGSFELG